MANQQNDATVVVVTLSIARNEVTASSVDNDNWSLPATPEASTVHHTTEPGSDCPPDGNQDHRVTSKRLNILLALGGSPGPTQAISSSCPTVKVSPR
jgi:hypothetical protein